MEGLTEKRASCSHSRGDRPIDDEFPYRYSSTYGNAAIRIGIQEFRQMFINWPSRRVEESARGFAAKVDHFEFYAILSVWMGVTSLFKRRNVAGQE
jgi:hypothetical protein